MKIIEGTATSLTPIHIGSGKSIGNFYPTLDYIPARAIRGMLGNYLYHENRDLYYELKIEEDDDPILFFHSARLMNTVAIPSGWHWCKLCNRRLLKDEVCPDDKNEGKIRKGWMKKDTLKNGKLQYYDVKRTISTKCPVVRPFHTSPGEGWGLSPYNIEVITGNPRFSVRIVVLDDSIAEDIWNYLKTAGIFYGIGGFRSKGYGVMLFEDSPSIMTAEDYFNIRKNELGDKNIMVLNSPMITIRDGNYYVGFLEEKIIEYLEKTLKIVGMNGEFEIIGNGFFAEEDIRGWTAVGGYHLDSIIPATSIGSMLEIKCSPESAAAAEILGIGEKMNVHGDIFFIKEDD